MRICVIYDCLFPFTVGGAERWYRNLAEALARAGHDVTYLTLRQWDEQPAVDGVRVVAVGPRMELYTKSGRRQITPPLRFGAGVLWHLLRYGRRYDVVHTASFPYFSLLAAAAVRRLGRYRLFCDWHEVWSHDYWREYLGHAGWIGSAVQRLCAHAHQRAFCFSSLYAGRLRAEGLRGTITVLEGEYSGPLQPRPPGERAPLVVFAGRHIPEKRAPSVVGAVATAAELVPGLEGIVFGDGPERGAVLDEIERRDAAAIVSAPGFVAPEVITGALSRALCMLLPSSREGYGMVVVEAAACGTPSILVTGADNAALELLSEGVNGVIARSADAADLAAAIVAVHEAGETMRASTRAWFAANARRLSLAASLEVVLAAYTGAIARS
jgi:glycosyltransferase involved in cell wall biosynthesis